MVGGTTATCCTPARWGRSVEAVDFNWIWHYWHADIVLDREWWTDAQGMQHDMPPADRHRWGFQPRWLEAVNA